MWMKMWPLSREGLHSGSENIEGGWHLIPTTHHSPCSSRYISHFLFLNLFLDILPMQAEFVPSWHYELLEPRLYLLLLHVSSTWGTPILVCRVTNMICFDLCTRMCLLFFFFWWQRWHGLFLFELLVWETNMLCGILTLRSTSYLGSKQEVSVKKSWCVFLWEQGPCQYRFVECVHEWMNELMLHDHRLLNSLSPLLCLSRYTHNSPRKYIAYRSILTRKVCPSHPHKGWIDDTRSLWEDGTRFPPPCPRCG